MLRDFIRVRDTLWYVNLFVPLKKIIKREWAKVLKWHNTFGFFHPYHQKKIVLRFKEMAKEKWLICSTGTNPISKVKADGKNVSTWSLCIRHEHCLPLVITSHYPDPVSLDWDTTSLWLHNTSNALTQPVLSAAISYMPCPRTLKCFYFMVHDWPAYLMPVSTILLSMTVELMTYIQAILTVA